MHRLTPADELADVRAEIARLRLREAQLKERLAQAPLATRNGRWNRVEVEEVTTRHFDPARLPPSIRDNPDYWSERVHLSVRAIPIPAKAAPPRPGWPIRRFLPAPAPH